MNDKPGHLATDFLDSMLGFNGERTDPVLGGYHLGNGYRLYNPALRRFTAPDSMSPFGAGGVNPYAYCTGDPINSTDPTGHIGSPLHDLLELGEGIVDDVVTDGVALPVQVDMMPVGRGEHLAVHDAEHVARDADVRPLQGRPYRQPSQNIVHIVRKLETGQISHSNLDIADIFNGIAPPPPEEAFYLGSQDPQDISNLEKVLRISQWKPDNSLVLKNAQAAFRDERYMYSPADIPRKTHLWFMTDGERASILTGGNYRDMTTYAEAQWNEPRLNALLRSYGYRPHSIASTFGQNLAPHVSQNLNRWILATRMKWIDSNGTNVRPYLWRSSW